MAQPITWQNVNGPNLAEALRPLQAAQNSIGGAFTSLGDILKERTAIEAANAVQTNKNNVQSYLDEVARQGATPEQLQASIQSGQLEKLRASFGGGADFKAATRGAAENLLADRYKQVQAATEFGNTMLNEKTAPIMDRFKQAAITGDEAGKEAARAAYTAAGGKHGVDLESFAQNTARDNLTWDEKQKGWVRDEKKFTADLTHMANQDKIAQGQLENARTQTSNQARQITANIANQEKELALRTEDLGFKREDRAEDRISKVSTALGALGSRSATSAEGTAAIFKGIADNYKDAATQNNARLAAAEIIKADPNATTAAVMAGVLSMGETSWRPWDWKSGRRSDALAIAKNQMAAPGTTAQLLNDEIRKAALLEQLKRAREGIPAGAGVVKNPFE